MCNKQKKKKRKKNMNDNEKEIQLDCDLYNKGEELLRILKKCMSQIFQPLEHNKMTENYAKTTPPRLFFQLLVAVITKARWDGEERENI